jgi:N-acetylmuramoyl-L-alanine amidase/Stage II sporulation protein
MIPKSVYLRLALSVFATLVFAFFSPFVFADETLKRDVVLEKTGGSLLSPIVQLEKPFNAVILTLGHSTEGLQVNFHPSSGGAWEPAVSAEDGPGPSLLLFTSPTRSVQFMKRPTGDESSLPMKAEFIFQQADDTASLPTDNLYSGPQTSSGLNIVSRAAWGADESLRYWTPDSDQAAQGSGNNESDTGVSDACGDIATKYKDEVGIDRVISTSPSGDALTWPLAYAKTIKKIIIHHTDSDIRDLNGDLKTDGQDFRAMVRAIYRFHAVTRGWGDIGYNYLIDPLGNVYEGRYGGDRVIGAHAKCFNTGTLGISIIGNYQDNPVPEPALDSLITLIALKSQQFGIDPSGSSMFHGKDLFNILGHRDVGHTTCPGDQLYALLPQIRQRAAFSLKNGSFTQPSSGGLPIDYNAESETSAPSVSLLPNERKEITLRFKNTGGKTWDSNTWLHVAANDRESARVVPLIPDKEFVAANMLENLVMPGDTATFKVQFEGGYFAAQTDFELSPVVNGRYKVSKAAVVVPVQVQAPVFSYDVVKSSLPSGSVFQGQKITGSLDVKNTGNITWVNYGAHAIRIGTTQTQDHASPLSTDNPARLAFMAQSQVKPGEIGTFVFNLEAPMDRLGDIQEHFAPVIESVGWLPDKGLGFGVTVKRPNHVAYFVDKPTIGTLNPGEMRKIEFTLENRGDLPWDPDTMKIDLTAKDVKIFKNEIIPTDSVPPKGSAVFSFWIQAPYKQTKGAVLLTSKFRKLLIRGGKTRFDIDVPAPTLSAEKLDQTSEKVSIRPNERRELKVHFKNTGNSIWRNNGANPVNLGTSVPQDRKSPLYDASSWESRTRAAQLLEKEVDPGQTGTFVVKINPQSPGSFTEIFQLVMEKVKWIDNALVRWVVQVSGDRVSGNVDFKKDARDNQANAAMMTVVKSAANQNTAASKPASPAPSATPPVVATGDKPLRVRISYGDDQSKVTSNQNFIVSGDGGQILFNAQIGSVVEIQREGLLFRVQVGTQTKNASLIRIEPQQGGIVEIQSMERRPDWNKALNDNRFRGTLEVRVVDNATAYIDELPLEDYLKGLAEVSDTAPAEKQKVIAILARTYARYYMQDSHRKFPGMPYDGSDDPAVFQRYLGYGVELRSPHFTNAVISTRDMVVTYQGQLVKTPYFNSDTGKTLSAQDVWGWTDTPYLQSVSDPYCNGLTLNGHGVGMSGCGAEGMAKAGKKYDEIIKYYYQGVEIEEMDF